MSQFTAVWKFVVNFLRDWSHQHGICIKCDIWFPNICWSGPVFIWSVWCNDKSLIFLIHCSKFSNTSLLIFCFAKLIDVLIYMNVFGMYNFSTIWAAIFIVLVKDLFWCLISDICFFFYPYAIFSTIALVFGLP